MSNQRTEKEVLESIQKTRAPKRPSEIIKMLDGRLTASESKEAIISLLDKDELRLTSDKKLVASKELAAAE
jgi:hypothetical protein